MNNSNIVEENSRCGSAVVKEDHSLTAGVDAYSSLYFYDESREIFTLQKRDLIFRKFPELAVGNVGLIII